MAVVDRRCTVSFTTTRNFHHTAKLITQLFFESLTLSTIVFRYDYIFGPTSIEVLTSEDGENFSQVAYAEYQIEGRVDDGNGCQDYTLTFPATTAKYLKVTAGCLKALPEWHSSAGRPGFLFVDEVIVK